MEYDFGGYATKTGHRCYDGLVLQHGAFDNANGVTVPLVYQHGHSDINNVLGTALLEARPDGVYAKCRFNNTQNGLNAKEAVRHGDISGLSIFAQPIERSGDYVKHGVIREVSLVLFGMNPHALIDDVMAHSGFVDGEGAIFSADLNDFDYISHAGNKEIESEDDAEKEATIGDVFESLTEEQQKVVIYLIDKSVEAALADTKGAKDAEDKESKEKIVKQSGDSEDVESLSHSYKEKPMHTNVFDKTSKENLGSKKNLTSILLEAKQNAASFKNTMLAHNYSSIADAYYGVESSEGSISHAATYGFNPVDVLFPDYKDPNGIQTFNPRPEWVLEVFAKAKKLPYSKIKTVIADITGDEARARGYITGNQKQDEVIALLKRTTDPTTVYKKQKLDRDDLLDITEYDVVAWLWNEMRIKLEEELSRAILIGDGRTAASNDKISETHIRPIIKDDPLYAIQVILPDTTTTAGLIDSIIKARKDYNGSGMPTLFTSPNFSANMYLLTDTTGRRIYNTDADLAAGLRVAKVVEVPLIEGINGSAYNNKRLAAIMVNMSDYSIGANKGGDITTMEDWDLDFNQKKFLMETRVSGALTMPHSAVVFWIEEP